MPGGQQHGLALRIVAAVMHRVEEPAQLVGRLVVLTAVGVGHGAPVVDGRLQLRPQALHEVEQPVRLHQLGVGRLALHQQRAGPVEAEIEIDQGQRLRVVGEGVEVERAMHVPEAVARQLVVRVELEGAAERLQGAAVATHAGEAEAAERVLDDAEPGQHVQGVSQEQGGGDQVNDVADVLQAFLRQKRSAVDAEAEGEAGADGGAFHLGLFLPAGEGQDVKQRHAREDLAGKDGLIDDVVLPAIFAELAEPQQQPARDGGGHNQAIRQALQLAAHGPQQAEDDAEQGAAADQGQEQRVVPTPSRVVDPGQSEAQAGQGAQVNQPGAFEQKEEEKQVKFAADVEPFAHLEYGRNHQGDEQPAHSGQVYAGEVLPGGLVRRRLGLIDGGVKHQAEENAFEDVFGLQPAHGGRRCSGKGRTGTDRSRLFQP